MKATKVKLYEKTATNGRKTLFLDFWPPIRRPDTGKQSRREHLGLYIYEKPRTELERNHNRETRLLAESIRAKRQLAVQEGEFGFLQPHQDGDFLAYFRALGQSRSAIPRTCESWLTAAKYLEKFAGESITFGQLNEALANRFKEFLLTTDTFRSLNDKLSHNSASLYFSRFLAAVRQAYKDRRMVENLAERLDPIPLRETQREFLTYEELRRLAQTDCDHDLLKRAALFSALTGLRWSDINKLTWGEVQRDSGGEAILRFRQKKTGGLETVPIADEAMTLLGMRGADDTQVFTGLVYSAGVAIKLKRWLLRAGITKDLSFHNFRHTFATLQLTLGTDIYTVSKLLGHRSIKTTEIYARVVDAKKRDAANKIKLEV
jgi:integrase